MSPEGDVILNHPRADDKVIGKSLTGKPFHIRVRGNCHDHEVLLKRKKIGEGHAQDRNARAISAGACAWEKTR
jgi:hypothetical protein